MIEEAHEDKLTAPPDIHEGEKRASTRRLSARRLTAVEIAEGALLADIGVIFQLIAIYLPVGGDILRMLVPIVFAIIVLRRGLYVGCMSFCVALFLVGVITGPSSLILMLLEGLAGLFLGVTMKYRIHQLVILLLGITSSALLLFGLFILADLFAGIPLTDVIQSLHQAFNGFISFMNGVAFAVGLGNWWQQALLPKINAVAQLAFTYWWAGFYLLNWIFACPVVIAVYYVTNLFVRMLGYKVVPFPGDFLEKLLYRRLRTSIQLIPKNGIGKHWLVRAFIKEVRRQGIGRYRAKS
ncbi:MAG TPA: DUF2232 domain-containing protein [Ktedonobacteraceae bacterium]|nr:DUF2232 domain-containing protein [Ktedonobacteraceae bacterium]